MTIWKNFFKWVDELMPLEELTKLNSIGIQKAIMDEKNGIKEGEVTCSWNPSSLKNVNNFLNFLNLLLLKTPIMNKLMKFEWNLAIWNLYFQGFERGKIKLANDY